MNRSALRAVREKIDTPRDRVCMNSFNLQMALPNGHSWKVKMIEVKGTETRMRRKSPIDRLTIRTFGFVRIGLLRNTMKIKVALPTRPMTKMMVKRAGTTNVSGKSQIEDLVVELSEWLSCVRLSSIIRRVR